MALDSTLIRDFVTTTLGHRITSYACVSIACGGTNKNGQAIASAINKLKKEDPTFPWWRIIGANGLITYKPFEEQGELLKREFTDKELMIFKTQVFYCVESFVFGIDHGIRSMKSLNSLT